MTHTPDDQLALYASGDLPEAQQRLCHEHLHECSDCRSALADFHSLRSALASLPAPPDADLAEVRRRVLVQIAAPAPRRPVFILKFAAAAAVACAAALLVFFTLRPQPAPIPIGVPAPSLPPLSSSQPRTLSLPPELGPPAKTRQAAVTHNTHRLEASLSDISLITAPNQETLMRIPSTDPNILILWQPSERNTNQ